jgi:SAM-dependent methyltransferase
MGHYDETFYNTYAAYSSGSAGKVVPHLVQLFSPKSVVDVGCGIGTWLSVFKKQGVDDIIGIDGDYVNRNQLLFDQQYFVSHDLTKPLPRDKVRRFDLAISLEVGEHLPASAASQFVDTMVSLAPIVCFSAAIPHQGGTYHINEQWQNYWAKLFMQKGYVTVDFLRSQIWGDPQVEYYYSQNSLIYIEASHIERYPSLKNYVVCADNQILSRVHPAKWLEAHNPPPPPLRNLMKTLPGSLKHTLQYYLNRISKKA